MTVADKITRALILRLVDYRDSDKIITFFSRDLGKISAIATGARSSRKRFGGALEPFAIIELSLAKTMRGGQMYRLAEATQIESHAGLASSLPHLASAALMLELVKELVQDNEPEPRLFDLLVDTLKTLSKTKESNSRAVAVCASMRAMALGGFAIGIDRCNACNRLVPIGKRVLFNIQRGGVICRSCGGGSINLSSKIVEAGSFLARSTIEKASDFNINNDHLIQLENVLEDFITFHLGHPLKTSSFRNQIGKFTQ